MASLKPCKLPTPLTELNTSKCEQTSPVAAPRSGGQERDTACLNNADHGRLQQSNTGSPRLGSATMNFRRLLASQGAAPGSAVASLAANPVRGHDAADNLSQSGAGAGNRGNRAAAIVRPSTA